MRNSLQDALFGFLLVAVVAMASLPVSAGAKPMTVAEVEASLRQNQLDWGRKWEARDAAGILAHYAPEAILFVPGEPPAKGRGIFGPFIHEILGNPNFSLAWAVDHAIVSPDGVIGYVHGRYVQHNPRADRPGFDVETGHYVTTFRRAAGKWLAVAEINSPGPIESREGLPTADFEPFKEERGAPTGPSASAIEARNIAAIRRHILEFWQEGRVEIAGELYAPNFVDHNPAPGPQGARVEIPDVVRMMHAGFSQQKYEIVHLFAHGDMVVDHWVLRARHTGEFLGIKPTNRDVHFAGSDIFRMKDGKITDIWHTEEIASLLEQLKPFK